MYKLTDNHEFVIENFQRAHSFSSFLPGIAGKDGIPLWAFYVNRGQAIAGFGIHNKDSAISEFFPADKSYQIVPVQGFRTFLKIQGEAAFEPFAAIPDHNQVKETLTIGENHLQLDYENTVRGLTLTIEYYTLPHSPLAGLIREVTLKNNRDEKMALELVDGLATIFPSGVENAAYKELGNTLKSWFDVETVDERFNFYHLRGSTSDDAHVADVHDGNYYSSLMVLDGEESIVKPVFDRNLIFGNDLTLQHASAFNNESITSISKKSQVSTNKVSGGFSMLDTTIEAGGELKVFTIIGYGENKEKVKAFVDNQFNYEKLLTLKASAKNLSRKLTHAVSTDTAQPMFDAYIKQNYLDNGLRGGFPILFQQNDKYAVFYLYSRKHGDLERDYNFFSISPTYYSQGNGNYRDINQNRRLDVLFNPKVADYNVRHFINLIQLDGYNPLAVKEIRYSIDASIIDFSKYGIGERDSDRLLQLLAKPFAPGDILKCVNDANMHLSVEFESFLTDILLMSDESLEAEHGEGFWIDHWTYNLDLIDQYIIVYPDKTAQLFFKKPYRFFDNPAQVLPRDSKYVENRGVLRQYDAVEIDKTKQSAKQKANNQWVKGQYGEGSIYETTLFSKLFLLAVNKTATIAPFGLGIEMEAGKPGWNDALNGLPGMFGSSTSELYELKRLLLMLQQVEAALEEKVIIPEEAGELVTDLALNIRQLEGNNAKSEHIYWENVSTIREQYRSSIQHGISGENLVLPVSEAKELVRIYRGRVDHALANVENYQQENLVPTYFYFEATRNPKSESGTIEFTPHAVTPFLEGIVKKLKLSQSPDEAASIYDAVRHSGLFDEKLLMYKTSMSITEEPIELGRAKFFTPGWLENESVFMHMEYKYLLEMLKKGLYEQFFNAIQSALVPFFDPAVYGRSILENSSFIASSANPDPSVHGRGFVARLTGATVELLNMWWIMFTGGHVFTYDQSNEELIFHLRPILPDWLFKADGTASFTLFSDISVTYYNPGRHNSFGEDSVKPVRYTIEYKSGQRVIVEEADVKGKIAEDIREGYVSGIDIELQ